MRANPAEIKVPKWHRSKAGMALKEIHKELWHLNEEMRRQRKSSHGRDPAVLALSSFCDLDSVGVAREGLWCTGLTEQFCVGVQ